jgi:predicted phosphodiesterase
MSKIGLAGDWHGNAQWARHALQTFHRHGIVTVFQLGDFGLGWPRHGMAFLGWVEQHCALLDIDLYIVPGNHENWEYIDSLLFENGRCWLTDHVCVLERNARFEIDGRSFLALGGAPSIDYPARQEGVSWWRGEALTLRDVERAADEGYADIMLTHDAPDGGTRKVQTIIDNPDYTFWPRKGLEYCAEGRELMNIAFKGVKPKVFVHGHFHVTDEALVNGTRFLSLGADGDEGNTLALDLDDLSHEWLATR